MFGLVAAVAGLVAWRLFVLSYMRHTLYAQTAQAQAENISNLLVRGNIYIEDPTSADKGGDGRYLVATNKKFPIVYAVPSQIADPSAAATQVASILGLDAATVTTTLSSKSSNTKVLARRLTDTQVAAMKDLHVKGLGVRYETDRYYPGNSLLSTVLGFLGYGTAGTRMGQYGIEGYFNDELQGNNADSTAAAAPRPADITLTIDRNIQNFAELKLSELLTKWHSTGGTIIVQNPQTGAIMAMADRPDFDPNAYTSSDPSDYLNRSVQEVFEPGSSYKPLTMAAGLDLGKVTPDTTFTVNSSVLLSG